MLDQNSFYGQAIPMQDEDYLRAAELTGLEPAVIQTVAMVETNGSPFLPDKRPDILFEAHLFGRHTNHRYRDVVDPNGRAISSKSWDRSLYGKAGAWQYVRLYTAMKCDPEAAVKSASFGAFQILGQEAKEIGYDSLEDFVNDMAYSAGKHLEAFCRYIKVNHLVDELRDHDWTRFARQYNGPGYAANHYDTKMADKYHSMVAVWASKVQQVRANQPTGPENDYDTDRHIVAAVQAALNALNGDSVPSLKVDGWYGPKTHNAIVRFEQEMGYEGTGIVDDTLLANLGLNANALRG